MLLGTWWEMHWELGEHVGNLVKTWWEHIGNQKKKVWAYKKVFSSLFMKCASCCCDNNVVDCMQRGGPIYAFCLLALISLCTNYQALHSLQLCPTPNPLPTKLTKQSVGVMGSTLFLCFGALSWIAWIKRVTLSLGYYPFLPKRVEVWYLFLEHLQ